MSPDSLAKARTQTLTAPFGTDDSASWERENDRFSPDKEKVTGPENPAFISSFSLTFLPSLVLLRHLSFLHRRCLVKLCFYFRLVFITSSFEEI